MINTEWLNKNKYRIIFFTLIFLLINYTSNYFRIYNGGLLLKINYIFSNPTILLNSFPISLNKTDLMFSFIGLGISLLLVLNNQSNKKKFRQGVEHGSAEWGIPKKDLKGMYNEKDDTKNIIFSEKTKMVVDNDELTNHEYHRNKNTIIIGGSGSGKTRFFVKPNIMQMNCDYVITDPKGDILNDLGYMLRSQKNYNIKVLNLIEFDKSMRYNPLAYVKNEQDILKVVQTLIKNTSGKDAKEDFWVTAEKLLYQALIGAILEYFEPEEKHLGTLADLVSLFEVKENDEDYISVVDEMFMDIEQHNPNAFCMKQYRAFKISAGETAKSILISCSARLAPLNIPAVRDLLSTDELQLGEIGNQALVDKEGNVQYDKDNNIIYRPNALFIIIPDTDTTFNFIASIMYTQMFNLLVTIADTQYNGKFPRHVRFLLDEFANIGEIPDFQTLIATIRSRNISATPILQTLSQLKTIYKDSADTIVGNCDTLVFLGGKEESTLKMISSQLGKGTIDDYNTSRTRSQSDSHGQNYSKLGRELMTPDELQKMSRSKAIVMIANLAPFIDNKYDITSHPNYKYHGKSPVIDNRTGEMIDEGKYWFDIDRYVQNYRLIYNHKMEEIYKQEDEDKNATDLKEEKEIDKEVINRNEEKTKNINYVNSELDNVTAITDKGDKVLHDTKGKVKANEKSEKEIENDIDKEVVDRNKEKITNRSFANSELENVTVVTDYGNIIIHDRNKKIKANKKPEKAM